MQKWPRKIKLHARQLFEHRVLNARKVKFTVDRHCVVRKSAQHTRSYVCVVCFRYFSLFTVREMQKVRRYDIKGKTLPLYRNINVKISLSFYVNSSNSLVLHANHARYDFCRNFNDWFHVDGLHVFLLYLDDEWILIRTFNLLLSGTIHHNVCNEIYIQVHVSFFFFISFEQSCLPTILIILIIAHWIFIVSR